MRRLAILILAGLAIAPAHAMYLQAPSAVDPTVVVTNETGASATLSWQTTVPRIALSPVRTVEVPADAEAWQAPQGFFLFDEVMAGAAVENVLYISLLGADGSIVRQVVLDDEIALPPTALEDLVLHLTIAEDGTLHAAID